MLNSAGPGLYFFLLLLLNVSGLSAQSFGNEWIDYNQQYYKIRIAQRGIYRLSYQDLLKASVPVAQIDPRSFQLFHRGLEQAIIVKGELDASFDPEDYLEFFGTGNDGTGDLPLYSKPEAQPHQYYNLFSDSTVYFLTWRKDNVQGKRIERFFENNINNTPPVSFYWKEKIRLYTSEYSFGKNYPEGTENSIWLTSFDDGEGWTGSKIRKGSYLDFTINNKEELYSGEKPILELVLAGRNGRAHRTEVQVGSSTASLRSLGTVEFTYYNHQKFQGDLGQQDFSPARDLLVRILSKGYEDNLPDFVSLSLLKIKLPVKSSSMLDSINEFILPESQESRWYLELQSESVPQRIYDLTFPSFPLQIGFNYSSGKLSAMVPSRGKPASLLIVDRFLTVSQLEPVNFQKLNPAANFLIVTNSLLRQPSANYSDPVKAYADYRSTVTGGGYKPSIMEIDQLFDQFNYGEISPLAIRKMAGYFLQQGNPLFLFLIGRGTDMHLDGYRNPDMKTFNFIPPAGFPASDMAFTAGLNGTFIEPAIPTGRLTARTAQQVENYLAKVQESESLKYDQLWRKNLVHLSGGFSAAEQILFRRYTDQFAAVARGTYLGGDIVSFSKKTDSSTELINISDEVNSGKSLITFFGHSSTNNSDIDIGLVSSPEFGYHNKGKYPAILVNGCNAGGVFGTTYTIGEDWIITADRGAVGFIAHTSYGYSRTLKQYSELFYQTSFGDSTFFGKTLGEIQQETAKKLVVNAQGEAEYIAQAQQMLLQGDPAVRIFGAEKPDYAIVKNSIFIRPFEGEQINAFSDSVLVGIGVVNYGKAELDSVAVACRRILSDGRIIELDPKFYPPVFYQDTLYFHLPLGDYRDFGENKIEIKLDPFAHIDELNEENNQATLNFFIPVRAARNLLPYNFALVDSGFVQLVSQSTDMLDQERNFEFEVDTTFNFSSGFKKSFLVNGKVTARQWLELPFRDTTNVFWRSRFADPAENEDNEWSKYTFTYIPGRKSGWGQVTDGQFTLNHKNGLYFNSQDQRWHFQETSNELQVKTSGPDHPELSYQDMKISVNGFDYVITSRLCTDNALNLLAFDHASCNPYLGLNFGGWDILDRRSCGRRPQLINNFLDQEILDPAKDYLTKYIDQVNSKDYVLIVSTGFIQFESWPVSLHEKLSTLGIRPEDLQDLKNGEPIIILGQKNSMPGLARFIRAELASNIPVTAQAIELNGLIQGKFTSGYLETPRIGPALVWQDLETKPDITYLENELEEARVQLIGIDQKGNESVLLTTEAGKKLNLNFPAKDFPFVKMKILLKDPDYSTPPVLKNWFLSYLPAPEGILSYESEELPGSISLEKGEPHAVVFGFENLSEISFPDSIAASVKIYNHSVGKEEISRVSFPSPKPGNKNLFQVPLASIQNEGWNDLRIFVNEREVPEVSLQNNLLQYPQFYQVLKDRTSPLLDVAFDGKYIMDGDIVSPSPLISIRIKDENKYLHKMDTSNLVVQIRRECEGCDFSAVAFSGSQMNWVPASANQDFQIEFRPGPLEDGKYEMKVQGADASGNKSGNQPFTIRFEVVNESSITNFYPYPNPFSTKTRFSFTLTGSELPEQIKIQIMTVSGKLVREINQDELGPIRIGQNLTEYAWDGRDEFGDQLANGVYLYRVSLKNSDYRWNHRESAGDKGFKNGIGKLYILR